MSPPNNPQLKPNEANILLAIQAVEQGQIQGVRLAAKAFNIDKSTLSRRLRGTTSRRDFTPTNRKLTLIEESVIVQYILDLDARGFAPRVNDVKDMADTILCERDVTKTTKVGKNWATNFITRQPALKTRFNRKYDYQRAKCEDPELIGGWFNLVRNTRAKYGIQDDDIYNFDESGFLMGIISSTMVVTSSEARNPPKGLQPGNREWITVIQGVGAFGQRIPPFVIFAGKFHLAAWYEDETIPSDWTIAVSTNGWTTNELGFSWIQHFNKHTKERTVGAYRLLILDGHESHQSVQF